MAAAGALAPLSAPAAILKAEGLGRSPVLLTLGRRDRHGRRAGACARWPPDLERTLRGPDPAERALSFGFTRRRAACAAGRVRYNGGGWRPPGCRHAFCPPGLEGSER